MIASMVDKVCFLTQFIRSHSLLLYNIISWILLSKKNLFANLTFFLYLVQSVFLLDMWYITRFLLHSLFHQTFNLLVILISLENWFQRSSTIKANSYIVYSISLQLKMLVITIKPNLHLSFLTNSFSSLLFLTIDYFFSWINFSSTIMDTNRGTWSKEYWRLGKIK